MTHPGWNVDSGDEVYSWVTDGLLPQKYKLFGVVCRHSCAIFHHGHVVLVPVLPADMTASIAGFLKSDLSLETHISLIITTETRNQKFSHTLNDHMTSNHSWPCVIFSHILGP